MCICKKLDFETLKLFSTGLRCAIICLLQNELNTSDKYFTGNEFILAFNIAKQSLIQMMIVGMAPSYFVSAEIE